MASRLLSELPFGAYLVYSPRGPSEVAQKSRSVRDAVKGGATKLLDNAVRLILRDLEASGLGAVFGPDVTLVPAPRSSPLVTGARWPAEQIAAALVRGGLGRSVLPCLERTEAVPKSSFQRPGERPNAARHFETMLARSALCDTKRITVVDDFVTKGNTLLAAGSRVAEVFPGLEVAGFALVRTLGLQPDIDSIVEPCVGRILAVGREAIRQP